MFDALSERFERLGTSLRSRGRLSDADLDEALAEVRGALLEADVELGVVAGVFAGSALKVTYASKPPTVILLAGLQGAGKTTAAAKLASWFKQQGRQPFLVGTDLQRPAAVEQLRVLAGRIGVEVYSDTTNPVAVARAGVAEAQRLGRDVVIIDTAGRLAIDEALMAEVRSISAETSPHYTFLVIDAVTGQDAVHT